MMDEFKFVVIRVTKQRIPKRGATWVLNQSNSIQAVLYLLRQQKIKHRYYV